MQYLAGKKIKMIVLSAAALVVFVTAVTGNDDPSETSRPTKPLTRLLRFENEDYKEAFESLDLNMDGKITTDELASRYFHKKAAFATKKFIQLLDTQKTPGFIDLEEFTSFISKDPIKLQISSITKISSLEERKWFYADEILTYVYLVLDQNSIKNLFDAIESPSHKDGKLDLNEITEMEMKLMNGNEEYKLTEAEAKQVLREIGAGSEFIAFEDFKEYVMGRNLGFLFRDCREKLTETGAEYENACLVRKLVHYSTRHVTEYLISLVFDGFETGSKDDKLGFSDIAEVLGVEEIDAIMFMAYISGSFIRDARYKDFRTVFIGPTYKKIFREKCLNEDKKQIDVDKRIGCLQHEMWILGSERFRPKEIGVPDLDFIFLFEDLDTTEDGTIQLDVDLINGRHWNSDLAKKFMEETVSDADKEKLYLYDFFEYVYEPYMMTALAECQIIKDNKEKLDCYNNELEDTISSVLNKKEIDDFYQVYGVHNEQYDSINKNTLEKMQLDEVSSKRFLTELGHGDLVVKKFEFVLFVKQKELSHIFSTEENVVPRKHYQPSELHVKLLDYVNKYMTERDFFLLFRKLDVYRVGVIYKKAIRYLKTFKIPEDLITKMAAFGNPEHASFSEFWLFLHSKPPGSKEPRKHLLDNGCAEVKSDDKIKCFMERLKSVE